jgi:hypothetical protein
MCFSDLHVLGQDNGCGHEQLAIETEHATDNAAEPTENLTLYEDNLYTENIKW